MLFSLLAVFLLWAGWTIAYFAIGNSYVLPSVGQTFAAAAKLLADGAFWCAFGYTLLRTLLSFSVSAVCGVALALLSTFQKYVRAFLAPVVSLLRTVPTMAVILVLLLWTSPFVAPVVVSFLVLFPAVYAASLASFEGIQEEYRAFASVYRISLKRQIFRMYLPLSAPELLAQGGAILAMGLKVTVSAEVLSRTYHSLGGMMQEAQMFVEMPALIALTVLTVLLGFALEVVSAIVFKCSTRWK